MALDWSFYADMRFCADHIVHIHSTALVRKVPTQYLIKDKNRYRAPFPQSRLTNNTVLDHFAKPKKI